MWRAVTPAGRRYLGSAGVGTGKLQSYSECSSQAKLLWLRAHRAGTCSEPPHRARAGRTRSAGPRVGGEVLRSSTAVSPGGAREGVELERSTLADWVGGTSRLLEPLVEALRRHIVSAHKLHADDTPVPVLAPGNGKTKTGRLWTYVRDDRQAADNTPAAVWFAYSPDRRGEHPREHLRSFSGTLQADAYAGFHHLYEGGRIQEAACWAHVRRKFYDLQVAHASPLAAEALKRIGELYAIESEIRARPPDERRQARTTPAGPMLESLHGWLQSTLAVVSRKSEIAAAIRYAPGRWRALLRYSEDGTIEIDNNAAERALRAVALGRKNYLFAGSDSGGERAAAIYRLIATAKLNGIDPEAYLRLVLENIADHPISRIADLLPWNLAAKLQPVSS
jgi:transposase